MSLRMAQIQLITNTTASNNTITLSPLLVPLPIPPPPPPQLILLPLQSLPPVHHHHQRRHSRRHHHYHPHRRREKNISRGLDLEGFSIDFGRSFMHFSLDSRNGSISGRAWAPKPPPKIHATSGHLHSDDIYSVINPTFLCRLENAEIIAELIAWSAAPKSVDVWVLFRLQIAFALKSVSTRCVIGSMQRDGGAYDTCFKTASALVVWLKRWVMPWCRRAASAERCDWYSGQRWHKSLRTLWNILAVERMKRVFDFHLRWSWFGCEIRCF